MWALITEDGANVSFVEGDYGIILPITVSGIDIASDDTIKVTVKDGKNGTTVVEKTITGIEDNVIPLSFDSTESSALTVGKYVYNLDWYRDTTFLCNIVNNAMLKVVDKA